MTSAPAGLLVGAADVASVSTPGPEALLTVLLAAGAAALLVRPSGRLAGPAPPAPGRPAVRPLLVVAGTGVLGLLAWSWLDPRQVVLAVQGAVVVLAVLRLLARRRRGRRADERADLVLAACESMASDLAAGQPPLRCLDRAAEDWVELGPVASAGRMGADVPTALRELATLPGAARLRTVAATWQVAHATGAGLAAALARAADAIRADRSTARLVASELAAAHATARMLAVLPVGVLLLGAGIGGDPLGFLTGTTPGLVCLGVGLGLSLLGLTWLERIADRVLR